MNMSQEFQRLIDERDEALAAKEAAEAREREAVMQSLAHLGQAEEAYEAQKKAEAEAAALREKLEKGNQPRCSECHGDGVVRRSWGYITCEACGGKGY